MKRFFIDVIGVAISTAIVVFFLCLSYKSTLTYIIAIIGGLITFVRLISYVVTIIKAHYYITTKKDIPKEFVKEVERLPKYETDKPHTLFFVYIMIILQLFGFIYLVEFH